MIFYLFWLYAIWSEWLENIDYDRVVFVNYQLTLRYTAWQSSAGNNRGRPPISWNLIG